MGGGESVLIGLRHPDQFAWIGGFSAALAFDRFEPVLPQLTAESAKPLKLFWIACGTSDSLIDAQRRFTTWLGNKGVTAQAHETPGIHNWPVWRDDLIHFAPLLFQ
jgi:enterochelin esterase family protein